MSGTVGFCRGTACCALTLVWLLLAACSPAPVIPTDTPRPTSIYATVAGPIIRETLPPTWTPSPTATQTLTPTITHTPTPVPTQSEADICAGFRVLHDFGGRMTYDWDDYIPIFATLHDREAALYFKAVRQPDGEGVGFELPAGGQAVGIEFQISALPSPGSYDWEFGVRHPAHGDICQITGSFLVFRPTATPIITFTPEATEEPTEARPSRTPRAN